eukprot:TRINITY_DN20277_c0_g1_i1.p1 TRINITY_DN20277_c0_g1~~TRINITY_DN20277_c0_g1_i1.p1  ORF type:complete len:294 (+),score=80.65 TRINITY_DN20277_c0_g1_i1:154-1035(+)
MEDIWKEAFPVGTEWDQYEKVYEMDWEFSNLEEAFEEDGVLAGKKVYLFGCTEPQLVQVGDSSKIIHIPAVVAVTAPFPPSDKLGIKSVQMETEAIVPMRQMKMDWVPYVPEDVKMSRDIERYRTKVFTLKCTQRKAALKQLKEERVKKYEYCLPYIYQPLKEEDFQFETAITVVYNFDDEDKPPLVEEFDWQFDEVEEFTQTLIDDEKLPAANKDSFKEFLKGEINSAKTKIREAKELRKKVIEDLTPEQRQAMEEMRFYKFYPVPTEGTPDITALKAPYINRYYGKAHQVL